MKRFGFSPRTLVIAFMSKGCAEHVRFGLPTAITQASDAVRKWLHEFVFLFDRLFDGKVSIRFPVIVAAELSIEAEE